MRILSVESIVIGLGIVSNSLVAYEAPVPPFAPPAGIEGSTAILYSDPAIKSWASDVTELVPGTEVSQDGNWLDAQSVIGPSKGGASELLVLGRGGTITLEFRSGIADFEGSDFVIFENAFSDTFLELAYVEVSSDGQHFVRFPNYSFTLDPVGSWGHVQATLIHGYAGKYRAGYGTPFDLAELRSAHEAVVYGYDKFSDAFKQQLLTNFPHVDLNSIRYVRLTDIVGDGTNMDCEGFTIYDPYPTVITAGFDLDAVGVLNPGVPEIVSYSDWLNKYDLSNLPGTDSDKDGWLDMLEYHFGTDPVDFKDRPVMKIEPASGGTGNQLAYIASGMAEGQLDLHYSIDGASWQLLQAGQVNPADAENIIWTDDMPFVDRTINIPDQDGGGIFFRWIAVPPSAGN